MVQDEAFEWDDVKAARNARAHGVNFETAKEVFKDPFATERLDDREDYGEQRYNIVGMVDGRVLYIAYCMRGDVIRIHLRPRSRTP